MEDKHELTPQEDAFLEALLSEEPLPEEADMATPVMEEEADMDLPFPEEAAFHDAPVMEEEAAIDEAIPEEGAQMEDGLPEEESVIDLAATQAFVPQPDILPTELLPLDQNDRSLNQDTQFFAPIADPAPEYVEESVEDILARIAPEYADMVEPQPEEAEYFPEETQVIPAVDAPFLETEEKEEFHQMMEAEPEPEAPARPRERRKKPKPARKGRPKRRKGDGLLGLPHLFATVVWLAIIIVIGSTLGKLLWIGAADVLAFGRDSREVTVTILESDDLDTISAKLKDAGLVKYPELFKFYIQLTDSEDEIISGYFELNTNLDYHALTNALSPSSSSRTVTEVMIPEGYNCRQIFALLEENHVCSVGALEEYAASGTLSDFWFLEDVERGDKYCLEGYLFPDTYQFYVNSTPREVLNKLLAGFDNRYSSEMKDQLAVLNARFTEMMRDNGCDEDYIAQNQFTVRDIVIVASMIEEETASHEESPTIASVIYNRLAGKNLYERYLNIDATIIYATGDASKIDTSIDHPYNTYKYAGLTPGPISNPGLASLKAALDPADTEYFYYVLNPATGAHQFSKTLEEHEKWVAQFREGNG